MCCAQTTLRQGGRGWGERKNSEVILPSFHPCGNFSHTSSLKFLKTAGSIGHAFTVRIHIENQNKVSFFTLLFHTRFPYLVYHLTQFSKTKRKIKIAQSTIALTIHRGTMLFSPKRGKLKIAVKNSVNSTQRIMLFSPKREN